MALGQRPTKQELTRKDIFQLIDGLLYEPSFASLYRAELHIKTRSVTADDTLGGWLRRRHLKSNSGLDCADKGKEHDEGVRDVRKIINDYKRAESLRPLAQAILDSGWDGSDPRGKTQKEPEEYLDFLSDLANGADTAWSDVETTTYGRLFKLTVDAYNRFMHTQNG